MEPETQNNAGQNIGGVPVDQNPGGNQSNKNKKILLIAVGFLLLVAVAFAVYALVSKDESQSSISGEALLPSVEATLESASSPQELVTQAREYIETSDTLRSDENLEQIQVSETEGNPVVVDDIEESGVAKFDTAIEKNEVTPEDFPPYRYDGVNRYATAADVSKKTFDDASVLDRVVIVNGGSDIDMALASSFAGTDTTVLLVERDRVPDETREELNRIGDAPGTQQLVVVGGSAAVSNVTAAYAHDMLGARAGTTRVGGSNRYETAVEVSKELYDADSQDVAYITSADSYADIMLANNATDRPVLLVDKERAPDETSDELCRLGTKEIIVVGGEEAVNLPALQDIERRHTRGGECEDAPNFYRYKALAQVSGTSRLETAVAISRRNFLAYRGAAILVNGYSAADMLSASVLSQGMGGAPILLTNTDTYAAPTVRELKRLSAFQIFVIGGENAVSEEMLYNLRAEQFNVEDANHFSR